MRPGDQRRVAAGRQIDPQVQVMRFFGIVLPQTPTYFAGRHADDRIGCRVIARLAGKDVYSERAFLQRLGGFGQRMLDHMFQKEPASLARPSFS